MASTRGPAGRRYWIGVVCSIFLAMPPAGNALASGGRDTEAAYGLGKSVMERKLACESCVLDHAPRSQDEAREVARRLRDGEIGADLQGFERWAVSVYLEERWDL